MLFEVKDVFYTRMRGTPFAVEALKGCSLTIPEGKITAIVGPTQAGKSTLLLTLLGLLRPSRGSVLFRGQDIYQAAFDLEALRLRVGIVFQSPEAQLFEETVGKDVSFGPRRKRLSPAQSRRLVQEALEAVGLPYEEFRTRYIASLSGGQKRRVAIAGVLALEPEAILFDEPMAGLDPQGRQELQALLQRLKAQRQLTIVLTSSSLADVAALADQVIVLHEGRVALSGSSREVLAHAEKLLALDITLPEMTQIALGLRSLWPALRCDVLTLAELEEELARFLPHAASQKPQLSSS
ncbi:ATP-binding cassette domain-containing protein [Thermogemmatispora carboxidivorans]|uniref:ATP-binding cassette domain-containing protein n=1 Tax=Thermogemmatispora carboxidivorans TaxID=1382306 RepID=UPI00069B80EE|nr:ATP-binding cassette domain-containing protein [Thermogemmatispora carboxidivorans]